MILQKMKLLLLIPFILFFSCGKAPVQSTAPNQQIILIKDFQFFPETLSVNAGDVVFFMNESIVPHHILSESAEDLFDDTGDIDSLIIPVGVTSSVTIPDDVISGDIIFFYDDVLKDQMVTSTGTFVVE